MRIKKGQASTEYLIILAVVVVVALIVVAVMGGIPGIGKGAGSRASASYWGSQDVAITDYAVSASGTDTIRVKNNLRNAITLSVVSVNGQDLETGTTTIGVGGTHTYTGAIAACTAGQSYSYNVLISYTDSVTSATYNISGDGNKLEGTCAN